MEIVAIIVGGLLILGVGLAVYERRRKRTLLPHDRNLDPPMSAHTAAEAERAANPPGSHGSGGLHQ